MKYSLSLSVLALFVFGSCLDSSEEDLDLEAPTVSVAAASSAIAPTHFSDISAEASAIPLSFSVADENGISEIVLESHNGFDGHVHGRSRNNDFILFRYRHTILSEDLTDPFYFETQGDADPTIFLDERNPLMPEGFLPLAGPYHFSIRAVDVSGNETSYNDNSTYHTTINLQRHYAPQVQITGVDRANGSVLGSVQRNEAHEASSDIVFLWVSVITPDPSSPQREGDFKAEWLWGESNWPHQFRLDSGAPLSNSRTIDLGELLSDEPAIRSMSDADRLRVWAEDENGNITVKTF
jgi:hypothetical protein